MIGSRRWHLDYRKHESISDANIWNAATCTQLHCQPFPGCDVKEESKIREILNKNESMMKSRRKEITERKRAFNRFEMKKEN